MVGICGLQYFRSCGRRDLAILLTAQCPARRVLLFSGQAVTDDLLAEAAKKGYKFEILAKPTHPTVMLETALNLLAITETRLREP